MCAPHHLCSLHNTHTCTQKHSGIAQFCSTTFAAHRKHHVCYSTPVTLHEMNIITYHTCVAYTLHHICHTPVTLHDTLHTLHPTCIAAHISPHMHDTTQDHTHETSHLLCITCDAHPWHHTRACRHDIPNTCCIAHIWHCVCMIHHTGHSTCICQHTLYSWHKPHHTLPVPWTHTT